MTEVETTAAVRRAHNKPTPKFLQAGCPSCHPTNSDKALKGELNTVVQTTKIDPTIMKVCQVFTCSSVCRSRCSGCEFTILTVGNSDITFQQNK